MVVTVESVADGPDIVLASKLTKKLEKELAAADLQPQLLDDDTVNDWFLPSNEELVGLLSAANVDLEALQFILLKHNDHSRAGATYTGIEMCSVDGRPTLNLGFHTAADASFTDCEFNSIRFHTLRDSRFANVFAQNGLGTRNLHGVDFESCRFSMEVTEKALGCEFVDCELSSLRLVARGASFSSTRIGGAWILNLADSALGGCALGPLDEFRSRDLRNFKLKNCRADGLRTQECSFNAEAEFVAS